MFPLCLWMLECRAAGCDDVSNHYCYKLWCGESVSLRALDLLSRIMTALVGARQWDWPMPPRDTEKADESDVMHYWQRSQRSGNVLAERGTPPFWLLCVMDHSWWALRVMQNGKCYHWSFPLGWEGRGDSSSVNAARSYEPLIWALNVPVLSQGSCESQYKTGAFKGAFKSRLLYSMKFTMTNCWCTYCK